MFNDRRDAGVQLAERLKEYRDRHDVLVLALPRGGAVTGSEIASRLNALFDIIIVRKLGFPGQPELAIGAVAETGTVVLNHDIISMFTITDEHIQAEVSRQNEEIARRIERYRGGASLTGLRGKTVILVDDGVATGATMKAAITALRKEEIGRMVVAVPVAPPETAEALKHMADEFICMETPLYFMSVGSYYRDFTQVTDEEVVALLQESMALSAARNG